MKRTLFLMLLCLINMGAVCQNNVPWQNAKGNGTLASPWLLENADQLDALANQVNGRTDYAGRYFALATDIEANIGTIIGDSISHPFRGFADGRGYSITSKESGALGESDGFRLEGLFGYLGDGAVITNLNVKGMVKAQGSNNCRLFVGAIAAIVGKGAKVQNCTASAIVSASGTSNDKKAGTSYVGNLVGYNLGSVVNCIASGAKAPAVSNIATPYVGTAIGYNSFSNELFTDPFAVNGKASLSDNAIGKITVTLKDKTGKTLASQTGDSPLDYTFGKSIFWIDYAYSIEASAAGYATTTTTPSFSGKTQDMVLYSSPSKGYEWYVPVAKGGTFDGTTYQIGTVAELQALAHLVNKTVPTDTILNGSSLQNNFKDKTIQLTANLDLGSISNWTPIGILIENGAFEGTFDGCGKTISNLSILDSIRGSGLFGYINKATIKDLTLHNVNIKNEYDGNETGSFVGSSLHSQLSDLIVTGTLSIIAHSESKATNAGGIVGASYNECLIANCAVQPENTDGSTYHISATGTNDNGTGLSAGGIAGNINGSKSITTNCFSTANVYLTHTGSSSYSCAGGIAGYGNTQMSNCYASGNVSSEVKNENTYCYVGGVVGYTNNLKNCYVVGTKITITGGSQSNQIGRVFGNKSESPTNIYANTALTINDKTPSSEEKNGSDMSALSSSPWWKPDGTQSMTEMLNVGKPADGNIIMETTVVRYTAKFREWKDGVSAAKPAVFTTNTTLDSNL